MLNLFIGHQITIHRQTNLPIRKVSVEARWLQLLVLLPSWELWVVPSLREAMKRATVLTTVTTIIHLLMW